MQISMLSKKKAQIESPDFNPAQYSKMTTFLGK